MQKSELLKTLQEEIHRHKWETFVYRLPGARTSDRGVVVPGCPVCEKRLETTTQFVHHITHEVLPRLLDKLSPENRKATKT